MNRVDVNLPPIRDDGAGYTYLCRLIEAVTSNSEHNYVFNFSRCSVLSHNGMAVIGGLCNYLKERDAANGFRLSTLLAVRPQKVGFDFSSISSSLLPKLKETGFLAHIESSAEKPSGSSDYIGYREHKYQDDTEIVNHLKYSWLTSEKLKMSEELKSAIISKIYEIFVNAYGHGLKTNPFNQSVISCGNYDSKEKKLSLSVLDLGCGIVKTVQAHTKLTGEREALEWALETGNSTRTDSAPDLPRGLGFGILKDFVTINKGKLTICSDMFMVNVASNGEYIIEDMPAKLAGTLVSITINCDDRYYKFSDENSDSETFF